MNNKERAFLENLYNTYFTKLYQTALKMSNDQEISLDAVQETFYTASKKISLLYKHPNREGWLYKTLNYKIKRIFSY